ncbi:MAG: hypothetical protein NZ839_04165, partial [Endomicrobia bacterium]|nr:hypothetical protein [Endomicrobiia bacterium]
MKIVKWVIILIVCMYATTLYGEISFGVSLGEPTGISLKLQKEKYMAYDIGCGFNTSQKYLFLSLDILKYDYQRITSKELTGKMPICYGFGVNIEQFRDNTSLGIRILGGIEYIFADIPLNIFVKIAPVVNIIP